MNLAKGARITLRLAETSPQVVYDFAVELPEATLSGRASVELAQGSVRLEAPVLPPEWLQNTMTGLLRSLWRARAGQVEAVPWPRRLTRWRRAEGASP
jgi:hypothetical protein